MDLALHHWGLGPRTGELWASTVELWASTRAAAYREQGLALAPDVADLERQDDVIAAFAGGQPGAVYAWRVVAREVLGLPFEARRELPSSVLELGQLCVAPRLRRSAGASLSLADVLISCSMIRLRELGMQGVAVVRNNRSADRLAERHGGRLIATVEAYGSACGVYRFDGEGELESMETELARRLWLERRAR